MKRSTSDTTVNSYHWSGCGMSLLFRVLFAQKCTSTHHKIAMDSLRFLEGDAAEGWRNLFLSSIEVYLDGSKAPDKKFRDFRNHVLHVADNCWGGAVVKTEEWYGRLVSLLRAEDWSRAVYAAGVLSHYYTDPLMPLHTGQSEREGAVHRAIEWSVTKSYSELQNILIEDLGGYPRIEPNQDSDWLAHMVVSGARAAHEHYDVLIDHYDLETGVRTPTAGFDQESKDRIAALIGHATIGFARILERAFTESGIEPPTRNLSLNGFLSRLATPLFWITRKLADAKDRATVKAIYAEVQEQGRAVESLPLDEREVRRMHAEDVLGITEAELGSQPVDAVGAKHGQGATPRQRSSRPVWVLPTDQKTPAKKARTKKLKKSRTPNAAKSFSLAPADPIVDAPSIGPKTASRLQKIGIRRVSDLLAADPAQAADQLATRHIDSETITDWQTQARLMCTVPGLRGHDAQILVGCGIEEAADLNTMAADELLELAGDFLQTSEGQRATRNCQPPDLKEVTDWITWAGLADSSRAA